MKKYVVGFLAGVFFAASATAFADTLPSLIGKKVEAQYTVEVNGRVLNTVVVEGSNYAPVRAFSEAAGYEVKTEGKNVKVSEVKTVENISAPTGLTKEQLEEAIRISQNKVNQYTTALATYDEASKDEKNKEKMEQLAPIIQFYKDQLAESQAQLTKFQIQLSEL